MEFKYVFKEIKIKNGRGAGVFKGKLLKVNMNGTSVKAALRIMGDRYNIQEISRELGITPTETWNMGDFIRNTGKKYKYSGWEYSIDEEETLDINTQ